MGVDCPHCGEPHPETGDCYKCAFPGEWLGLIDLCEELIHCGEKARDALFMAAGTGDDSEARKLLKSAAGMCADFGDVTGVEELPWVAAERAERLAMWRARRKREHGGVAPKRDMDIHQLGSQVRLPDGRCGTVVYNSLVGVGIKFGLHDPDLADFEYTDGNTRYSGAPDDWPWEPEALLRDPWPGADKYELECVGEEYDIIRCGGAYRD